MAVGNEELELRCAMLEFRGPIKGGSEGRAPSTLVPFRYPDSLANPNATNHRLHRDHESGTWLDFGFASCRVRVQVPPRYRLHTSIALQRGLTGPYANLGQFGG
ncbi:predicted protein [Histoplasma capsulatum G186AR]|uniref:Uncharacterized protein n=1 Tax=Ajellomyces capsulatus (strain G186AR / H82 / ATCC MYA-2454 / RMSCC 2432) TaxID=447093 RepID=C0NMV2_AJECG|nr:uncharacterized protein HCBG_04079 [Histoplasma capsulatum G186AR]EEH07199.1 predicted protein [Histoplasma capsulatum G186AR]